MSKPVPLAAAMPPSTSSGQWFESEVTAIGNQTLVPGVTPIKPRDRLAIRANAPLEPRKPQRPIDHGLFDTNARLQIEMF